jgi:hypothetical protein
MSRSMPPLGTVAVAALLTACPQKISALADAAATDQDGSAPSDAAAADAGTATDGAPSADDAGPEDASDTGAQADSGAPLPPLTFGRMAIPASTAFVTAIWGRSSGELYAGTSNGKVMKLEAPNGWANAWSEPSNLGIIAIWGTATRIFIGSESTLHVFDGTVGANVASYPVARQIYDVKGRSDNEVYIVGDQQNGRGFFIYDGTRIMTIIEPMNVATLASIGVVDGGPVYVGGSGAMFKYESGLFAPDAVMWPNAWTSTDISTFTFNGILVLGDNLYATGSRYEVFYRQPAVGTWTLADNPLLSSDAKAIAGVANGAETELYVAGFDTVHGAIRRYYHGNWTADVPGANDLDLASIWALSVDEYYAVGAERGSFNGVILKARR